ncbi:MAG: hypothetical protein H6807_14440 [Planctomycetes bacterium]|nr:hypothetical protein [Planctomycetota bacterium]
MSRFEVSQLILSSLLVGILLLAPGCATTSTRAGGDEGDPRGDAWALRLWKRKCVECHGLHAPSRLSDEGWRRVMDAMAIEARLDESEKAAILSYLQDHNES